MFIETSAKAGYNVKQVSEKQGYTAGFACFCGDSGKPKCLFNIGISGMLRSSFMHDLTEFYAT